jgi:hypothetical protein
LHQFIPIPFVGQKIFIFQIWLLKPPDQERPRVGYSSRFCALPFNPAADSTFFAATMVFLVDFRSDPGLLLLSLFVGVVEEKWPASDESSGTQNRMNYDIWSIRRVRDFAGHAKRACFGNAQM